jgi:glutaredoxin
MNFAIFSKEGCPYCDKIKQVLELTESKFVVYTLGTHFDKDAFYGEFGEGSTFPQVICGGKKLGGTVDAIKFLKENGIV